MEDRGCEYRVGMAFCDARHEIVERAHTAGCDHGHGNRVRNRSREFEVVAELGAVAIHRGKQDLTRAVADELDRVLDRIDAGGVASAMSEDLEAAVRAFGIDGG